MDFEALAAVVFSWRWALNASTLFWMRRPTVGSQTPGDGLVRSSDEAPGPLTCAVRKGTGGGAEAPPPVSVRRVCRRLAQEREDALRRLVGLREHARAGLLQDPQLREVDHLLGHVHVADPALGRHQILLIGREVVEAVLQAVLDPAQGDSPP